MGAIVARMKLPVPSDEIRLPPPDANGSRIAATEGAGMSPEAIDEALRLAAKKNRVTAFASVLGAEMAEKVVAAEEDDSVLRVDDPDPCAASRLATYAGRLPASG